jgi:hypothetical protein
MVSALCEKPSIVKRRGDRELEERIFINPIKVC